MNFEEFEKDLAKLINKHSMESGSGTPDFILAAHLTQTLKTFNASMHARESWYDRPMDKFGMPPIRST